jgi:hypothetical protein
MRSGWHLADCCRDRNQAVVARRYVEDLAFVIDGTPEVHPFAQADQRASQEQDTLFNSLTEPNGTRCGGRMIILEVFARGAAPRGAPCGAGILT